MKKLLLLILLPFTGALAQPQFTANNCFSTGDSTTIGVAIVSQTFSNFLPLTGFNYTWDFSSAGTPGPWTSWTSPTTPYLFRPSAQSPQTLFQNTQINEFATLSFSRDLFYTYSAASDTLYQNGLYTGGNNYEYRPRIPYFIFPMSPSATNSSYTKQFTNPNQPTTATGSISRTVTYDGYGTLILPYGQISDVIRLHTVQTDSTYVISLGTVGEELIWIQASTGIPVLRFLNYAGQIVAYYTDATTTVSAPSLPGSSISIFPNPASKVLNVYRSNPTSIEEYQMVNVLGQQVMTGTLTGQTTAINIELLPKGVYFITFTQNSKAVKVIVE